MAKVVTFGELMLRLAPEGYYRFVQADKLGATFGGGEANVAVSLANYGFDASFVTKLPKHEIGQAAVNSLMFRTVFGLHVISTNWQLMTLLSAILTVISNRTDIFLVQNLQQFWLKVST